jgi:L-amino acid N-acyltransferase YncA
VLLEEFTNLAAHSGVKKLLARIVSNRSGTITAFEKAGFSQVTTLPKFVKDIHQQSYADIALLVKEIAA